MYHTFLKVLFAIGFITIFNHCKTIIPDPPALAKAPVYAERDENNSYQIIFEEKDDWKVYKGTSVDKINWTNPIGTTEDQALRLQDIGKGKYYFGIINSKKDTFYITERQVPLNKQGNFRDIGGYQTQDGRVVKWGKIYRSGKLSDLSKRDVETLNNLGLKAAIDFRSEYERAKHPDNLPPNIVYYHEPIGDKEGHTFQKLQKDVMKKRIKGQEVKELFMDLMKGFTDSVTTDFKPVIDLMIQGDAPLVYHCSGGKDRTGFMSAVILSALGVDRETIRKDYLASNYYRYDLNKKRMNQVKLIGIKETTSEYLFLVHNDYFDTVFEIIDNKYGGIDNYLEVKFGLTPVLRQQLIENYTFDPKEIY